MTDEPSHRGLWVGVALGAPVMALAVWDALGDSGRTKPFELVLWVLGGIVVIDLVVLPIALGIGRLVRPGLVRWAIAAAATIAVVAWPFVRGYGRNAGNPSLLPRDYGKGTLVVVLAIGAIAALGRRPWRALMGRGDLTHAQPVPSSPGYGLGESASRGIAANRGHDTTDD